LSSIRVVTQSLLAGGTGRADPIAEVLLTQRADIILLTQADDPDVLARLAWRLGADLLPALGPRNLALLTTGAVLESANLGLLQGLSGGLLTARLRFCGRELSVALADLSTELPPLSADVVAGQWQGETHELADIRKLCGERVRQAALADPPRAVSRLAVRGEVRDAWVETDRLATYAADNYPIGVELA
jgi:hypothetical protein